MHKDDIEFAKEEIEASYRETSLGRALPFPFVLLKDAIEEIESLQKQVEELTAWQRKATNDICEYIMEMDTLKKQVETARLEGIQECIGVVSQIKDDGWRGTAGISRNDATRKLQELKEKV